MSYQDMALSHVKELVRDAFELEEVVVDADDDLPFPCGTAMFYMSVVGHGHLLRVWSRAVSGIRVTKAVLAEINEVNAGLTMARVWSTDGEVWVEGCLPIEPLRVMDLRFLSMEVGTTADRLGSMLAAVHGGRVAFPEGAASDCDHECED